MKQYDIRQNLPSIKVDKALIEQLERYILFDVPSIIKVENQLLLKNYNLEIVDSLGSGKFHRISEFPLSLFQNGTQKIIIECNIHSDPYFKLSISLGNKKYNSVIDISLKGDNPSELTKAIYSEIISRIEQHKTYNFIYHNDYIPMISGFSIGAMSIVGILAYMKHFSWSMYLFFILLLITFISNKGEYYKPYCEFSTTNQIKYNKTFNFIIVVIIIPIIIGILFEILK